MPETLAEALTALDEHSDALIVAGGTTAVPQLTFGEREPAALLSLSRVDELREHDVTDTEVRVGSMVTFGRLMQGTVADRLPGLAQVARSLGSPQVRNLVTIGGNVAGARAEGDSLPMLVALDAAVEIASVNGTRIVPVAAFLEQGVDAIGPGELIRSVLVPVANGPQHFAKVARRSAFSAAIVCCGAALDATARRVGVAIGGVGRTPARNEEAERRFAADVNWARRDSGAAAIGALVDAVLSDAPVDTYRTHAAGVLIRRAVAAVLAEARR